MRNTSNGLKKNAGTVALVGAAVFGLLLTAIPVQTAKTATTAVTITASVQDQQCQGGDFVNVTLTATLNPPQRNVRYSWDFDNDGIFDTAPSRNPTVSHLYPDEVNATATVRVTKGTRSGTDSVSFATLRCEN